MTTKVLLVDDNPAEVDQVRRILTRSHSIDLTYYEQYAILGDTEEDISDSVEQFDLLVLDVLMEDSDPGPFVRVVNAIDASRPFIAFTMLKTHEDIALPAGPVELQEFVFSRGGLGVVSKTFGTEGTDREVQFRIIERVMQFHWSR